MGRGLLAGRVHTDSHLPHLDEWQLVSPGLSQDPGLCSALLILEPVDSPHIPKAPGPSEVTVGIGS